MEKLLGTWGMVLAYVLLNAFGAILIKHKLTQTGAVSFETLGTTVRYLVHLFLSPQIILAFTAIFGSALAWIIALSRMELSIAYPVAVSLNFLLVVGASFIFYGEPFTLSKLAGLLLAVSSVYFLAQ